MLWDSWSKPIRRWVSSWCSTTGSRNPCRNWNTLPTNNNTWTRWQPTPGCSSSPPGNRSSSQRMRSRTHSCWPPSSRSSWSMPGSTSDPGSSRTIGVRIRRRSASMSNTVSYPPSILKRRALRVTLASIPSSISTLWRCSPRKWLGCRAARKIF